MQMLYFFQYLTELTVTNMAHSGPLTTRTYALLHQQRFSYPFSEGLVVRGVYCYLYNKIFLQDKGSLQVINPFVHLVVRTFIIPVSNVY